MLEVKNLHAAYGNIMALKGISFTVEKSETVVIIGSNGSGKSTILKCITGILPINSGVIRYKGKNITNLRPKDVIPLGISIVPERREIFSSLTVDENLTLGAYAKHLSRSDINNLKNDAYNLFPALIRKINQIGSTLSGGEQQMLAIGRALMGQPELLLLDEPSLGLAPLLVEEIFRTIGQLKSRTAILLIEQNARLSLQIADRAYVIRTGIILMEDTGENLLQSDKLEKLYLGE
jgi:branched-chain amino acid transport system ATP-binding protein